MDDARLVNRVHRLQHLLPEETYKVHVDRRVLVLVSREERLQICLSVLHQLDFRKMGGDDNVQLLRLCVNLIVDEVNNARFSAQTSE